MKVKGGRSFKIQSIIICLSPFFLDCGCIYYQRVFPDDDLNAQIGIFRNAEDGSCEKCMLMEETWKERVVDEIVAYNSGDLKVKMEVT